MPHISGIHHMARQQMKPCVKAPFRPCACAFECTLERFPLLLLCIEFYHYYNTSTTLRLCWCPAKNRGTPSVHLLQVVGRSAWFGLFNIIRRCIVR